MTRYTVTWWHEARDELARLWLHSSVKPQITLAANSIDRELRYNPAQKVALRSKGFANLQYCRSTYSIPLKKPTELYELCLSAYSWPSKNEKPTMSLKPRMIHQGDSLQLMRKLDAGSIDLVFADPPFNTWYFARVADTFKERHGFHGCQMSEQLLGRIIRTNSNQDELVFDPFSGSGTTLAVAKKLGWGWLGCELSAEYVNYASDRLEGIRSGDAPDGPVDAVYSAPSTKSGRRLDHSNADKPHVSKKRASRKKADPKQLALRGLVSD